MVVVADRPELTLRPSWVPCLPMFTNVYLRVPQFANVKNGREDLQGALPSLQSVAIGAQHVLCKHPHWLGPQVHLQQNLGFPQFSQNGTNTEGFVEGSGTGERNTC